MIHRRSTGTIAAFFAAFLGTTVSASPARAATPAPHIVVAISQSGSPFAWFEDLSAGQEVTHQFAATVPSSGAPPAGSLLTSTLTTSLGGSAVSVAAVKD